MERKTSKEISQQKESHYIASSSNEGKKSAIEKQGKPLREISCEIPKKDSMSRLINQQNFLLSLDENGNAALDEDCLFYAPVYSNLIVKILNGSRVSKNACLVLSKPVFVPGILAEDAVEQNEISEKNNSDNSGIRGEEEQKQMETDGKESTDQAKLKIDYENLFEMKNNKIFLSIGELKEISKYYNLSDNFNLENFEDNKDDNTNKKHLSGNRDSEASVKLNRLKENFDPEKIKAFENHLVFPITYDTDIYFVIPCIIPGPLTFFLLYEPNNSFLSRANNYSNNDNCNMKNNLANNSSKINNLIEIASNNNYSKNESDKNCRSALNPLISRVNIQSNEITILIEPKVKIGGKAYDVESLSIQTILSKSLGTINEWDNYFQEASLLNYNFVHFTPVQVLGKSDSLYCIKDQTEINDVLFDMKLSKEEKYFRLKKKVEYLKDKYRIKCLIDIVLNHTAIYSEWLLKHPEAGYNLENCPHLTAAYELDKLILDYSQRFAEKKVSTKSAPFVNNENDLNDLISELSNEIYRKNFEEYFLVSIENNIEEFISFYKSYKKNFEQYLNKKKYLASKLIEKKLNFNSENDIYQIILESADNYGASRHGVNINCEFISILLIKEGFSESQFLAEVKKYLNRLNEDWKTKCKEFLNRAIENVKACIRYEFIQLKRFRVTDRKRLVENYFTTFEPNNKKAIFACNGWLFGVNDPTVNFAKYGFWNYFNRSIVIWGDCVKLNYEEKFDDSDYLVKHMTEYVVGMAKIFDGFRLDNAHSTPISLAEHLMRKAREANPNLIIIAELFTGVKEREIEFVNKIGINMLIREIIYCWNTDDLCENLYKFGGGKERILGKLNAESSMILDSQNVMKYEKLQGRKPKSIMFDITHDNPTLHEKYSNLGLNLTFLCCNSMIGSSIGSTRGFDQLFPYQPSVVKEKRPYHHDNENFEDILSKHKDILGDYSYPNIEDHQGDIDENGDFLSEKNERLKSRKGNNLGPTLVEYNKKHCQGGKKYKELIDVPQDANDEEFLNEKIKDNENIIVFEFNPSNSGINYTPNKVCLVISSNNWKPDIILEKVSNDLWQTKLKLNEGTYEYKYIIDSHHWVHDRTKLTVKGSLNFINNQISIGPFGLEQSKNINKSNANTGNNSSGNINIKFSDFELNYKDLKYVRREMNYMRRFISEKSTPSFSEFFIHKDRDILLIYRNLNRSSLEYKCRLIDFDGFALICRSGFDKNPGNGISSRIELPGIISELVFFSTINIPNFDINTIRTNPKLIGVDSNCLFSKNMKHLWQIANITRVNGKDFINFHSIKPNTNILLKVKFDNNAKNAIVKINENLDFLENNPMSFNLIKNSDIADFNHFLFKCEAEELSNTNRIRGNYEFQEIGKLVYAGISHLHLILQNAKCKQSLEHKIFDNVRSGDWLLRYNIDRLKDSKGCVKLANFLSNNIFSHYVNLPIYLKPHFITRIVDILYDFIIKKIFLKIEEAIDLSEKGEFFKCLLVANLQFLGNVESSKFQDKSNYSLPIDFSIAAGLPHFAVGYMRCWGRDTFIAFKGLLLIPGFYKEAKQILINFSSTMRHGLIPNLLDCGNNSRFNSRDAVWYYLQAIKDYLKLTDDYNFLNEEIYMIFLDDDMGIHLDKLKKNEKKKMRIQDIILAILFKHANGIEFREWRAGRDIDSVMSDEGFNVKIFLDPSNGFLYGGNTSNCGTWMDKMGSSEKAKNKGIPSTPSIHDMDKKFMNQNYLKLDKIKVNNLNKLTFAAWAALIKENFEKHFYINKKINIDGHTTKEFHYKDYLLYNDKKYQEYQLRPNFLIAMSVAPELFSKEKALKALELVEKYLLIENALGVRTLDYEDPYYLGDYDNSNDTNDFFTAHGFNYHNGPEWIWPIGYYIIAKCYFNNYSSKKDLKRHMCNILIPHYKNITTDAWRGLPELTNKNNKFCVFSCKTQAWSIATILDALYTMLELEKNGKI